MESQDEPTVLCTNCEKHIPESKSFLHEAYCFRHIIKCSKCNEPINKNEVDLHENEYHKLVSCPHCRRDFEVNSFQNHVANCSHKPKMCQFCNTEVSNEEFYDHIDQCGSRTRKCAHCGKNILIRNLEDHEAICAIEQFTREATYPETSEEDKNNLFEDIFSATNKRRPVLQESKIINKKRFEPNKKLDAQKKRLVKLAESRTNANQGDKTQEELDEEIARELNREHYEGRRPQRGVNRQKSRQVVIDSDNLEEVEAQTDEEFFGFKHRTKPKMDIEKPTQIVVEDDDERMARQLQEQFDTEQPSTQPSAQPRNSRRAGARPNYNESLKSQDIVPEFETSEQFYSEPQETQQMNPEFYAEGEDAELQRAIAASLEGYKY